MMNPQVRVIPPVILKIVVTFSFALFAQTANGGRQKCHVIPHLP